jgi:mono/diheme cytochrome c family protein
MPYYVFHNMTDDDADAIVAFLRTVPAVTNDIPRRGAMFDLPAPANYLNLTVIPTPADTFADKASALRGRYLATQTGLCVECHTPHLMGADPLDVTKYFAGGEDFSGFVAPLKSVSKNLTSDNTTGLGMWTAADVKKVLQMGKAKDGSGICPPMPLGAYMGLTEQDATDIANYIKSLPAIVNNIVDMCVFPPVPPDGGTEAGTDGGTETAPETAPEAGVDADEVGG